MANFPLTSFLAMTFTGAVWIGWPSPALARQQARPTPSEQPAPMLERINAETQALYEHVRPGLVRVQLPLPKWMEQLGQQDNPVNRWPLDPQVKETLESPQARIGSGQMQAIITASPSTQPQDGASTQPADGEQRWQRTVVQRPDGTIELVAPSAAPDDGVIAALIAPRSLGIIYDEQGHIVVPRYVERETCDDQHPLTVFGLAGGAATARFVGSDRQTNLTVLKLEKPLGKPAPFVGCRPTDGSLVMLLAQGGDAGRLIVWTRAQQEQGVIVGVDGNISGFARYGQFLDARICKPVVDQLIAKGQVSRASLGVLVTEGEAPDGRMAMHVDRVKPDSAAQAAGIREGDYILSVAGSAVDDLPSFAAAISAQNGLTKIQILRGSELIELQVELRPK
jgi:S1-C subfamily serine protease